MTNERVSQLLQDVESMIRYVLLAEFQILGSDAVENLLKAKQAEGEFISPSLNKALLDLATQAGGQDLRQRFSSLITDNRREFKEANSVWQRVLNLIEEDDKDGAEVSLPKHLRSVEYLTFPELADTFIQLINDIFPQAATDGNLKNRLTLSWRESLAKVRRLRNRAAHLRNVEFQDIEDLVIAIEGMRKDIINYCSWRS
jgi:hypothetical protein